MEQNFQALLLEELKKFLAPIRSAAQEPEIRRHLLARLGWDELLLPNEIVEGVQSALQTISTSSGQLPTNPSSLREVIDVIASVQNLINSISQLTNSFDSLQLTPQNLLDFLDDTLSLLLLDYLERQTPRIFWTLVLLDIFKVPTTSSAAILGNNNNILRIPTSIPKISLERIVELINDPVAFLKTTYLPNGLPDEATAKEFSDFLLPRLAGFLSTFGFLSHYGIRVADQVAFPNEVELAKARRTFQIRTANNQIGATFLVLPQSEGGPALEVTPKVRLTPTTRVIENWALVLDVQGTFSQITIAPDGVTINGTPTAQLHGSAQRFGQQGEPALLLGSRTGTRLELGWIRFDTHFNAQIPDFGFGFYAQESAIFLDTSGVDGFLQNVLPPGGIEAKFDLGIEWSRLGGVRISGSFGLEVEIPLHFSIGNILKLESIYLALRAESGNLSSAIGLSAGVSLGPVSASIKQIGLELRYGFNDQDTSGLVLGLLPPTGLGFGVDADPITGVGFLNFRPLEEQYDGILTLALGDITITAIGLITTRLPGGKKGFSGLLSLSGIFGTPIELVMGLTLSAVGGLGGINRTMIIEELQKGVRTGSLNSILFPEPSVVNAKQIINEIGAVFPAHEGRFVFGPMIRIGWGSPKNVIFAEVGIFISLPGTFDLASLDVVLVGKLEAMFPNPKDDIIRINLHILGTLSMQKKEFTFQASLFDSEILGVSLRGDTAVLLNWGRKPEFIMSFGGFHPKFTPPPPEYIFGGMQRLGMMIDEGPALFLLCESYLALTPNSFQFGARVEAEVNIDPINAGGGFAFDALFYFNPFSFEISAEASFFISVSGFTLADLKVDFLLSGPTPWHAAGSATIKLLFFDVSGSFDITWGRQIHTTIPAVNPWGALEEALEANASWSTAMPPDSRMVERLQLLALEGDSPEPLVVHPAGSLEVRQTVVPFGVQLRKFGTAPVTGFDQFELQSFVLGGAGQAPAGYVEEHFARGEFDNLSKHARLTKPSFEKMVAGGQFKSDPLAFSSKAHCRRSGYESVYLINEKAERSLEPGELDGRVAEQLAARSASALDSYKTKGKGKFMLPDAPTQVRTSERRFYIVDIQTLKPDTDAEAAIRGRASGTSSTNANDEPLETPGAGGHREDRSRWNVDQVLERYLEDYPTRRTQLMVVADYEVIV